MKLVVPCNFELSADDVIKIIMVDTLGGILLVDGEKVFLESRNDEDKLERTPVEADDPRMTLLFALKVVRGFYDAVAEDEGDATDPNSEIEAEADSGVEKQTPLNTVAFRPLKK